MKRRVFLKVAGIGAMGAAALAWLTRSDAYAINDLNVNAWKDTSGLTPRNLTIDTSIRNLVLFWAGQSLESLPTLFTPVNASAIDQLNIYDGLIYPAGTGPMLGTDVWRGGTGSVAARTADKLVTNGIFDRVILIVVNRSSSSIAQWAPGGQYDQLIPVAMRRLKARGIVPGLPNVTFAKHWMIGEQDALEGTKREDFKARFDATEVADRAEGFEGRTFITLETYRGGVINQEIRAAQMSVVNGKTIFQSGDIDTLTDRDAIDLHLVDTSGEAAATLICNAMHASGNPY